MCLCEHFSNAYFRVTALHSNFKSRWEVEEDYCHQVKSTKQYNPEISTRLLDLIDSVVFDFLLDNGDRHHYEVPLGLTPSSVFLFDNGKR